jgi:hypothetical protein
VYEALEISIEALSAQPSPGGQGAALLESLVARWRNHAEEIGVSDNLLCQKIANCTMRHAAELQAVLAARQPVELIAQQVGDYRVTVAEDAITVSRGRDIVFAYSAGDPEPINARQPVGEPVFRDHPTHNVYRGSCGNLPCHCWADEDHIIGDEVKRYATPPAQAVDHEVTDAMVDKAWNRFEAALHADDGDTPEDRVLSETIDQRDRYHEMADELAGHIVRITGVDIGEHSSANCPWQNAIEAAEAYQPAQAVDLGQFRELLTTLVDRCGDDLPPDQFILAGRLLNLVHSQA